MPFSISTCCTSRNRCQSQHFSVAITVRASVALLVPDVDFLLKTDFDPILVFSFQGMKNGWELVSVEKKLQLWFGSVNFGWTALLKSRGSFATSHGQCWG